MLDKGKFKEGMSVLCEMFSREPSKFLLQGYYMVLQSLTEEQFERAIENILADRKYNKLPLPAEIKEMVLGKAEDKAIMALDKLEKGMARIGKYNSAVFDDPLIHAVVETMGGWIKLCSMEWEEWKFARKDFERIYKAYMANFDRINIPTRLIGISEHQNDFNCLDVKTQVEYAGDKQQALAWIAGRETKAPEIENKNVYLLGQLVNGSGVE